MVRRRWTAMGYAVLIALALLAYGNSFAAQTTSFTYQGRIAAGGVAASGNYDFQFTLWDSIAGGTQQPQPSPIMVTKSGVNVVNGAFTTLLDFGANSFPGADRFLEIGVRPSGGNTFTGLSPRQQILGTPYAVRSASAAVADGLSNACAGCVQDVNINSISGAKISGAIPAQSLPAGSGSYIQNSTSQQAASDFNISGNGTVGGTLASNVVNAATRFDLNGNGVLSVSGGNPYQNSNTFVGVGTGISNSPGSGTASGNFNSFVGNGAGHSNTTGGENSFFGANAGYANLTGQGNSFFGDFAGNSNTASANSSFFGSGAGYANTGAGNSFFGQQSGNSNSTGASNSFFGIHSGIASTQGSGNSFIGAFAGGVNTTGSSNTLIGSLANVGSNNLTNATAIGANALVSASNSLVLGSVNGVNSAVADTKVGIGTTGPGYPLTVAGNIASTLVSAANSNSLGDAVTGSSDGGNGVVGKSISGNGVFGQSTSAVGNGVYGQSNSASGYGVYGYNPTVGGVGVYGSSPSAGVFGQSNSASGYGVGGYNSAGGHGVYGSSSGFAGYFEGKVYAGGDVGIGTTTPAAGLQVERTANDGIYSHNVSGIAIHARSEGTYAGYFEGFVRFSNLLFLDTLGSSGTTQLCRNASNQLSTCSSSLRYKTDVQDFSRGMDIVSRLRSISFDWKQGGSHDIGLAAEEVEKVEPLLTFRNDSGEIEGVKYNELSAVFVNAFKEQQAQIEHLQAQINQQDKQAATQQQQIDALKDIVCRLDQRATMCRQESGAR